MQKEILTYRVYWDEESFIATVEASFHIERNHGADADGRRGAPRTFIDDVLIVKVTDDAGNDLTVVPDGLKNTILSVVEDHI